MAKRVSRRVDRSPEEKARLQAIRDHYQSQKPTPEEVLAESGQPDFLPLGTVLLLRQVTSELRRERERQHLTLNEVASRAGMDPAVLSRLETGRSDNPTVETLYRVAAALGKELFCQLRDGPVQG